MWKVWEASLQKEEPKKHQKKQPATQQPVAEPEKKEVAVDEKERKPRRRNRKGPKHLQAGPTKVQPPAHQQPAAETAPPGAFAYKNFDVDEDNVQEALKEKGVAVVPGVLNQEELAIARKALWQTLEELMADFNTPFQFDDESTWRSFYELMPLHGMLLQHWGIGQTQFVWDIRQHPKVASIFARLWNVPVEQLLVSFDGMSVHLMPEVTNKGQFQNRLWMHVDQSYQRNEFECIQGFVSLWDCDEGDATLACYEGSHKFHAEFGAHFNKKKSPADWQMLRSPAEHQWLREKGCTPYCVQVSAGSLVLWDSRTVHQGIESSADRKDPKIRCVVYVCYQPRSLADEDDLALKQKAFKMGRMTTHWPAKVKLFDELPRLHGRPLPPVRILPKPVLTELGEKLAGF